jgi:predicted GIY-YIG superfamily endonuclease
MNTYYIYIMTNRRKTTVYIGMTNDIERRVYEHKNHLLPGFTSRYNLEWLVYIEETSADRVTQSCVARFECRMGAKGDTTASIAAGGTRFLAALEMTLTCKHENLDTPICTSAWLG